MKKIIRIIPAALLAAADIVSVLCIWQADEADQLIFVILHFVILCAFVFLFIRDSRRRSGTDLPDYWLRYLSKKIIDIQKRDMETGSHGDSFIFITDLHYNANDGHSAGAAEYILSASSVSKVFIGGDMCNGSSRGKQVCVDQLMQCCSAFGKIKPFYLRGNHDNNTEISSRTDEKTLSDSELYGIILKPVEDRIVTDGSLHYYMDNDVQKIRYICLDTGHPDPFVIDDAQILWMQDRIRELDAGWTVVVLTHQFYSDAGIKDGNGDKILAGLNAVCRESAATIACVVCGHCHADCMEISSEGFPVICTTCDARGGEDGGLKRRPLTYTEQAFDVFHIDTAARRIHVTRIGAGSDRQASY